MIGSRVGKCYYDPYVAERYFVLDFKPGSYMILWLEDEALAWEIEPRRFTGDRLIK